MSRLVKHIYVIILLLTKYTDTITYTVQPKLMTNTIKVTLLTSHNRHKH